MKLIVVFGLVWLFWLSAGCSGASKKESRTVVPVSPEAKFASEDLDELLRFSGELARMSADQRVSECDRILQMTRTGQSMGLRLHLFLAQLLTESCGDIRETSSVLKARQAEIRDERVRNFLALQAQVWSRLEAEMEQNRALDLNLKFSQQQARKRKRELITFESEAKNCESELMSCESVLERRSSELKTLQEKLDALKSIEQNLGGAQAR
jgi:hypothetical protein